MKKWEVDRIYRMNYCYAHIKSIIAQFIKQARIRLGH
jgi:hypothetical protein